MFQISPIEGHVQCKTRQMNNIVYLSEVMNLPTSKDNLSKTEKTIHCDMVPSSVVKVVHRMLSVFHENGCRIEGDR